jgi:hypothetical protein
MGMHWYPGIASMTNKVIINADKVLISMHAVMWLAVSITWFVAWREEPAPVGPSYRFAFKFISNIDALVSPQIEALSVRVASLGAQIFNANLGLTFAVLFGILMLFAGSIQWFLIGRFLQWTAKKYGQTAFILLGVGVIVWVAWSLRQWIFG